MDELVSFASMLVARGVHAAAEDMEGDERILVGGRHRFWLEDGKITCDRGAALNLAAPGSVDTLIEAMMHCSKECKCGDCSMWVGPETMRPLRRLHPTPDGISNDLYDYIGWACGQPGKNCTTLCGRYEFHYCPLK